MKNPDLTLKVDRARLYVMQSQPFYGTLLFGLVDKIGKDSRVRTAKTDGRRIFWDSEFLENLTDEETRFILLHETLHCAHGHLWRFSFDDRRHNAACDYALNLLLSKTAMGISMPEGGLMDKQYEGLAEEEILARLPENPPSPQGAGNGQDDVCGGFLPPNEEAEAGKDDQKKPGKSVGSSNLREQWDQRVIQASQAAKATGQGTVPSDMQRVLDRVLSQRIDWRRELSDFIRHSVGSRNDWTRSPRRHAHQSVIYPRKKQDEPGVIIGVRDTSGSISDQVASEFCGLLQDACDSIGAELLLIDCDARIRSEHRIGRGCPVPLTAAGGGGTDLRPPFDRAAELIEDSERISGLIYCTDLDGPEPDTSPVPVLWVSTTTTTAKTGRTVHVH